ncbi:MAG: phosphatidylglycerophosphatase A [Acidobacteriota bacterium]|nr:phosphatidylglycerophosphatase A [Acidobacteriota bacterium]
MVIKESSDELNPAVVITCAPVAHPRAARSPKDYLALTIATCGVGYLPLAPGTWGSLIGVGLYLLFRGTLLNGLNGMARLGYWPQSQISYAFVVFQLLGIFIITLVGVWAASRTEKLSGNKDPGKVVIDEVAGQLIALTAIPIGLESWWLILVAFLLFRFFDIIKPYPARQLESLEAGLGIMSDDIVAGMYAALVVAVAVVVMWFI